MLKPNARQCSTSAVGVQQKYGTAAAVTSQPMSHMDHLADRVSTGFELIHSNLPIVQHQLRVWNILPVYVQTAATLISFCRS